MKKEIKNINKKEKEEKKTKKSKKDVLDEDYEEEKSLDGAVIPEIGDEEEVDEEKGIDPGLIEEMHADLDEELDPMEELDKEPEVVDDEDDTKKDEEEEDYNGFVRDFYGDEEEKGY